MPVSLDPDLDCTGEGVCAGACQADQSCKFPGPDTPCDTCKACDRAGACDHIPASGDDEACGTVSCAGLSTECRSFTDLSANRCWALGLCARSNDPEACTDTVDQADGTPCTDGVCIAGECRVGYDGGPIVGDGGVVGDGGPGPNSDGGCGCRTGAPSSPLLLALLGLLALLRRRRS